MQHISSTFFLFGLLLLLLLAHSAEAQPTTVAQADSLKGLLGSSKPDTNRVHILLKLSDFYLNKTIDPKRDLDSALVLARQAEELGQRLRFTRGLEGTYFLKGKIYIRQQHPGTLLRMLESLSDTNRIKLFLELGQYYLRPSYTQDTHSDSVLFFFRKAESLSKAIGNRKWQEESRLQIGSFYLEQDDLSQGKPYFMHVIESRQKAGDKAGEAIAWFRMGFIVTCTAELCEVERQRYNAQALNISRQLKDRPLEAFILLAMGNHYMYAGDTKQTERTYLQALSIQRVIGYPAVYRTYHAVLQASSLHFDNWDNLSNAHYSLAEFSFYRGDFNKSLFYILEAIKDIESTGNTHELDYAYYRLGNVYFELGQLDKSIDYYQQSLAISQANGMVIVNVALAKKMTRALIKQGRAGESLQLLQSLVSNNVPLIPEEKIVIAESLGECYTSLKQYNKAERYYLQSIGWSKHVDEVHKLVNYVGISRFYVASAQYAKAYPYLNELLTAPEGKIPTNILMEIHLMRFKVDSAGASYPAAIKHYQLYKALNDSIFNETQSQQIEQLGVQYETGKKEQALKLKEKNIALLQEQSKVQHTQRNALICGTCLLMAMLALGYNRYRLKQRSNQLLQAQQQKLQTQHEELQVQQEVLQSQQSEINQKNEHLSELLGEKDSLLGQKDTLIGEKEGLLSQQQRLLQEKERLLKDIHHRVKNNLQVIMSLLNSQADSLVDKAALSAIQESQHRVQAMALIHQKLYQAEGVARIPMHHYIQEVVAYLHESYCLDQLVRFCVEVEPIELDVTQAVPLGLIINEVITNAFKYAFPYGRPGTVSLRLHQLEEATYQLTIADDGVGLPKNYDPSQSRSLGMTLLHGFSGQLGGELTITSQAGLTINLVFAEEQLNLSYDRTSMAAQA